MDPGAARGLRAAELGRSAAPRRRADREDIERRAVERGLQPLRWPDPFPFDSAFAMRAATYAKQIGRAVAFSLAAFRQAYAAGRDLGDADNVLIAAAACEMHPAALLKGAELRSIRGRWTTATTPPARAACATCPPCAAGDGSSTATAGSRRPRRRSA